MVTGVTVNPGKVEDGLDPDDRRGPQSFKDQKGKKARRARRLKSLRFRWSQYQHRRGVGAEDQPQTDRSGQERFRRRLKALYDA